MNNLKTRIKSPFQGMLTDLANYNLWANEQMVNWLIEHLEEKFKQEILSSYTSIHSTIQHIFNTQNFWLKMIQKEEYGGNEDISNTKQLFEKLIQNSNEFRDFVNQLDEFELQEKVEIITSWFSSCQPRYELIQQVVNHGTYHRGQVVTIGRNLNITNATNTDFNFYLLRAK